MIEQTVPDKIDTERLRRRMERTRSGQPVAKAVVWTLLDDLDATRARLDHVEADNERLRELLAEINRLAKNWTMDSTQRLAEIAALSAAPADQPETGEGEGFRQPIDGDEAVEALRAGVLERDMTGIPHGPGGWWPCKLTEHSVRQMLGRFRVPVDFPAPAADDTGRETAELACPNCGASASLPLGLTCADHRPAPVPAAAAPTDEEWTCGIDDRCAPHRCPDRLCANSPLAAAAPAVPGDERDDDLGLRLWTRSAMELRRCVADLLADAATGGLPLVVETLAGWTDSLDLTEELAQAVTDARCAAAPGPVDSAVRIPVGWHITTLDRVPVGGSYDTNGYSPDGRFTRHDVPANPDATLVLAPNPGAAVPAEHPYAGPAGMGPTHCVTPTPTSPAPETDTDGP